MISNNMHQPTCLPTLGELRSKTAHLPDETLLAVEDMHGNFPAVAVWVESDTTLPVLIFEPSDETDESDLSSIQ